MTKLADGLITLGLILLGLILAMTPLALWVAWTQTILLIILAIGAVAGVLYCVLADYEKPADLGRSEPFNHGPTGNVSDEFVAELQRLSPFIYHNRLLGDLKFQRAMDRLKKLLHR